MENSNHVGYLGNHTYMAQTFKARDRQLYKIEIYMRAVYEDTAFNVELWSLSDPDDPGSDPDTYLETLCSKSYSAVQTDFWETCEFDMETLMTPGKYYAIVVHTTNNACAIYYDSNDTIDGMLQYSDDGTTWTKWEGYNFTMKLYFGSKIMRVEDLGYSEAYVLRVEYLENGTRIVLDDEINLYGDQGDVDDLPSQILIPFKKAKVINGSVKFYGVGIP